MEKKEMRIMKKVKNALPKMCEFEKGYLLCLVETAEKREEPKSTEENITPTAQKGKGCTNGN